MKAILMSLLLMGMGLLPTAQAWADSPCSIDGISGHWVFATGVGHSLGDDITAIGTMNIAKDGSVSGMFDVTIDSVFFVPGVPYSGSVSINSDCTGTLTFVTGVGTQRTDSIVVVSRREMLGMSQDITNLWTYQVRRIPRDSVEDEDEDSDSNDD